MDIHTTILETYFFTPIDQGILPAQTPLFSGTIDDRSLADELCARFGISAEQAEKAIDLARMEVEL